jgi:hypothetical protein
MPEPSADYPYFSTLYSILESWNPDVPDPPTMFTESLQHFNYSNIHERDMARLYRDAEVPFKLYDIPDVDKVRDLWTNEYLLDQFKYNFDTHVESSTNNHFMYWAMRGNRPRVIRE